MAVDLADFVPSLRREITPPGGTQFDGVSDDEFVGHLADAFWEARLDGFLSAWSADEDGVVVPLQENGPDLPREQVTAIIVYAGVRMLRSQILNTQAVFRAKAGPVEYEVQNSANVLTELLKQLRATKERLIASAAEVGVTGVAYIDAYATRLGLPLNSVYPYVNAVGSGS